MLLAYHSILCLCSNDTGPADNDPATVHDSSADHIGCTPHNDSRANELSATGLHLYACTNHYTPVKAQAPLVQLRPRRQSQPHLPGCSHHRHSSHHTYANTTVDGREGCWGKLWGGV